MRGERSADPSRVHQCPGCGLDVLPTTLGTALHNAEHLERAAAGLVIAGVTPPPEVTDCLRAFAWRKCAYELQALASDLRGQIAHLEDERRRLLEDVATRDDAIEDLTADYSHLLDEYQGLRAHLGSAS